MELTGCTRHHAAWLLRCWGTTVWDRRAGRPVKIVVGQRRSRQRTPRVYDEQTVAALTKLWRYFGYLCGKRLAATLRLWLPHYERWNARSQRKIALSPEVELSRFGGQVTAEVGVPVAEEQSSRRSRPVKRMLGSAGLFRAAVTPSSGRCTQRAGAVRAGAPRPDATEGRSRGYPSTPTVRKGLSGPV